MHLERLSSVLQSVPDWARLGLAVPNARLWERAADALAATVIQQREGAPPVSDPDQFALPL